MNLITARAMLPFRPETRDGKRFLNYLPFDMYRTAQSIRLRWS